MSLVLDALRRVEKSDARTGAVGVTVASYRPARRIGRSWTPLMLGLMAGGAGVFLFGPTPTLPTEPASDTAPPAPAERRTALGGAGLPPPLIIESTAPDEVGRRSAATSEMAGSKPGLSAGRAVTHEAPKTPAPLVLQAISERDSLPIAVISDQLVKEGDLVGRVRVVKIGSDSVEVLLESGLKEVVRFAPPPPDPTPSPEGR